MKKLIKNLLVLSSVLVVYACNQESGNTDENGSSETVSSIDFSTIEYDDNLLWFPDLKLEVDQKQYVENYLLEFEGSNIFVADPTMLKYENMYLTALKEGDTYIVYRAEGKYKKINVNIAPKGSYTRAYTFEDIGPSLAGKFCCNFGDSLSFDCTVGDFLSVYPRRFATKYKMHEMGEKYQEYYFLESPQNTDPTTKREFVEENFDDVTTYCTNYAVGGATSLYPPNISYLYESHSQSPGFVDFYNGCSRIQILLQNGDLAKMDVMFITFGYDDYVYQPEIDIEGDDRYCIDDSFATCNSFKGCWRYMINCARAANPDIRIVLMNMIYNQHDYEHGYIGERSYWKNLTYHDLRKAVYELGYEMDVKVIDPWNYMKQFYDYYEGRTKGSREPNTTIKYDYIDEWHPSVTGHKYLFNFLCKW